MRPLSLAVLLAIGGGVGLAAAGEYEDLGDKFYQKSRFDHAVRWYRKAISGTAPRDALWAKYDAAVKALLLQSGEVRPAGKPPNSEPDSAMTTSVDPVAPATASAPEAPPQPPPGDTPVPAAAEPPPPTPAQPEEPESISYRPGERVTLNDPTSPATPLPPGVVDGGNFRVDSVSVDYNASGAVVVRGRLTNTGDGFLHYPRVYVSIFDKQDQLRGRNANSLSRGTTNLGPQQSEEFAIAFPTYRGPVGAYSVEMTGSR
ncbi:MAG: hypothetical protein HYY25_02035 [Candidatus Wallbacteria bacterium]|nr:hypothetical protein [Candidatus Wallbacteria bacterium]